MVCDVAHLGGAAFQRCRATVTYGGIVGMEFADYGAARGRTIYLFAKPVVLGTPGTAREQAQAEGI